jgi:hypothetical protein
MGAGRGAALTGGSSVGWQQAAPENSPWYRHRPMRKELELVFMPAGCESRIGGDGNTWRRFREPPAANLQSCQRLKRLPSRRWGPPRYVAARLSIRD